MRCDRMWLPLLLGLTLIAPVAHAEGEPARPVSRAPLAVSGAAVLKADAVALSYRYERVDFRDTLSSRDERSAAELVQGAAFASAPDEMEIDEHVFGLLWAPIENLTLSFSLPFLLKRMDSVMLVGPDLRTLETHVEGFGDFEFSLLYQTWRNPNASVHLNLGVSLPSGSLDEAGHTPASGTGLARLAYPMQLGSGTVDLLPGVTSTGHIENWFWGGQLLGRLHAGSNSRGYRRGNRYEIQAWGGRDWLPWLGSSFRLRWQHVFNIDGADPAQAAMTDPIMDPERQAGERLDALFGVDFFVYGGRYEGVRLAVEAGLPAYQRLDGPQPRQRWQLSAGIEYAF